MTEPTGHSPYSSAASSGSGGSSAGPQPTATGTGAPGGGAGAGAGAGTGTGGGQRPGTGGGSGGGGGSKKGIFGCLGCLGIAFVVFIVLPTILLAVGWMNMHRLAAPSDTDWAMVEPTEEEIEEIEGRVEAATSGFETEGSMSLRLTERDLNVLMARALAEQRTVTDDGVEFRPQARVRIVGDQLLMDAMLHIPEDARGVPGPLRGHPIGMELGLRPRVDAGDLVLGIEDVRLGRIPIPVMTLLGILQGMAQEGGDEIQADFIDPETGDIRIPAEELSHGDRTFRIDDLRLGDGALYLELSQPPGATPPDTTDAADAPEDPVRAPDPPTEGA